MEKVKFTFVFSSINEHIDDNRAKQFSPLNANAKLLKFSEELKTANGKCRINMVTWSSLPFAVIVVLNLSNDNHWGPDSNRLRRSKYD